MEHRNLGFAASVLTLCAEIADCPSPETCHLYGGNVEKPKQSATPDYKFFLFSFLQSKEELGLSQIESDTHRWTKLLYNWEEVVRVPQPTGVAAGGHPFPWQRMTTGLCSYPAWCLL